DGGGVDGGGGSGGSGVVDVCGGDDGDVVWCGVMMVTVVAAGGEWRRVAASGYGDRVDRVMRITFGFGRNVRRKTFPAAAAWWPAAAAGRRR
ncbi:hypothetical protein Tco_1349799, partial [Tanacetum coccineum]